MMVDTLRRTPPPYDTTSISVLVSLRMGRTEIRKGRKPWKVRAANCDWRSSAVFGRAVKSRLRFSRLRERINRYAKERLRARSSIARRWTRFVAFAKTSRERATFRCVRDRLTEWQFQHKSCHLHLGRWCFRPKRSAQQQQQQQPCEASCWNVLRHLLAEIFTIIIAWKASATGSDRVWRALIRLDDTF